ncbi:TPA: hypothetical protein ACJEU7_003371 [Acinetobacter baumannii]|uniref:hypothetical protein n=1 Tax=Acinetobacter baumannii TaxID=470 RepID=UPI00124AD0B7|nr:hypothetical protein [Acinetobacter baumannii]KAB1665094.1 hypothetical protein F8B05_19175 [Acinetobacter baumannii]MCX3034186.1 hypothetical protein [Acinetobacter baumannii]
MTETKVKELLKKHIKWIIFAIFIFGLVLGFNFGRYYAYTEFTKDAQQEINELKTTLNNKTDSEKSSDQTSVQGVNQSSSTTGENNNQGPNEKFEF